MTGQKKRLHFVYAVPNASIYRKLSFGKTPVYRNHWKRLLRWPNPISAPFSITYHILRSLEGRYEVLLYDVQEQGAIDLRPDDQFLGHIWPDARTKKEGTNCWTHYDEDQVTNQTILRYPNDKRVCIITPFNHSFEQLGWGQPLMELAGRYIGICGDHWVDQIGNSPFPFLQNRLVNLNMGIDTANYPRVKQGFNPAGKRRFLYIGRVSAEKNTSMLEQIAAAFPSFEGGYIGNGTIKGWKQIAASASLTPRFMKEVAAEYDFFINTSTYDAQATTILEAMSWGFVAACTPETGYTEEHIFRLSTTNLETNLATLHRLNHLSKNQLEQVIAANQQLLQQKFTWNHFGGRLLDLLAD